MQQSYDEDDEVELGRGIGGRVGIINHNMYVEEAKVSRKDKVRTKQKSECENQ